MELYKKIENILDDQAKTLVGVLCKRIEVLEKEKQLTPNLYKSLTKELIYEHCRFAKKLINLYLTVGTIVFKSKEK